jgi:hypothetical protein
MCKSLVACMHSHGCVLLLEGRSFLGVLASSFDMRHSSGGDLLWQRRLFPLVNVGPGMATAAGKAMALLWQVFLVAGPHPKSMRNFLLRVRSITTDMGVERLISGSTDLLPEFYKWIGAKVKVPVSRHRHLFPRALCAPGWCHIMDTLVRRGCHSRCWKLLLHLGFQDKHIWVGSEYTMITWRWHL